MSLQLCYNLPAVKFMTISLFINCLINCNCRPPNTAHAQSNKAKKNIFTVARALTRHHNHGVVEKTNHVWATKKKIWFLAKFQRQYRHTAFAHRKHFVFPIAQEQNYRYRWKPHAKRTKPVYELSYTRPQCNSYFHRDLCFVALFYAKTVVMES